MFTEWGLNMFGPMLLFLVRMMRSGLQTPETRIEMRSRRILRMGVAGKKTGVGAEKILTSVVIPFFCIR